MYFNWENKKFGILDAAVPLRHNYFILVSSIITIPTPLFKNSNASQLVPF